MYLCVAGYRLPNDSSYPWKRLRGQIMAILHDFLCSQCGKVFESMVCWNQDSAPCKCGSLAGRVFLSRRAYRAQAFDPVLVYRDAAGHYRFPGRNSGQTPKGYEPVYLKTTSDVRRFEKQMNQTERERYFTHKERTERAFSEPLRVGREELRERMKHMSPRGRDMAEAAMRANDNADSVDTRFDPAFHLNAFSFDSSNREAQHDVDLARRK
jgi:hypothetical protein